MKISKVFNNAGPKRSKTHLERWKKFNIYIRYLPPFNLKVKGVFIQVSVSCAVKLKIKKQRDRRFIGSCM